VVASREWEELRKELEVLAAVTHAFNAYVLDAWDNVWCAARWFTSIYPEDLIALLHTSIARKGIPLQRGGKLDVSLSSPKGHAYLRTYGSCYVLLLRFGGPFDEIGARAAVDAALARLELLTVNLPPPGGPGSSGNEAVGSA